MDFRFTPEERRFREEVCQFLDRELPPDWPGIGFLGEEVTQEGWAFHRALARKLGERGWLAMTWPKKYGGHERSYTEQVIFREEMAYRGAPGLDSIALGIAGPTILVHGTEEQRGEHLPPITRGEVGWAQLFSEPSGGSDLAAVYTRAVEDGDDFLITGQKVWISGGHRSDWGILVARTDPNVPKHKGLSYFLVDLHSPGVTIRPILTMANVDTFSEVFLDGVRVPRSRLLGQKDMGWYVAVTTLDFERGEIALAAGARRLLEQLVAFCREASRNGRPLAQDPGVRHKLAEIAIEIELNRVMAYWISWVQSQGKLPNYEASAAKLFGTELQQRLARTGMEVMGLYGQLGRGSRWAPLQGRIERLYTSCIGLTIMGGTSEIQRGIIALRGLGLPRG